MFCVVFLFAAHLGIELMFFCLSLLPALWSCHCTLVNFQCSHSCSSYHRLRHIRCCCMFGPCQPLYSSIAVWCGRCSGDAFLSLLLFEKTWTIVQRDERRRPNVPLCLWLALTDRPRRRHQPLCRCFQSEPFKSIFCSAAFFPLWAPHAPETRRPPDCINLARRMKEKKLPSAFHSACSPRIYG